MAGHAVEHLPHSVQLYASIRFFQLRSNTSFAPNVEGGAASVGALLGSMAYNTSFWTAGIFVSFPAGSNEL